MYGDVMAMVKKQLNDFTLDVAIGGSINDRITNSTRIDSKNASLKYANVFNLANIVMSKFCQYRSENRCPLPTAIGLCDGTDWL